MKGDFLMGIFVSIVMKNEQLAIKLIKQFERNVVEQLILIFLEVLELELAQIKLMEIQPQINAKIEIQLMHIA
jgi:hypothetical protein